MTALLLSPAEQLMRNTMPIEKFHGSGEMRQLYDFIDGDPTYIDMLLGILFKANYNNPHPRGLDPTKHKILFLDYCIHYADYDKEDNPIPRYVRFRP